MSQDGAARFNGLIDLAADILGGRAVACSDDFFASMESLVASGRGVFVEGKYTDRGKWMDGWESRRRRGTGHDWCVVELGVAGRVLGVDIDTNHFLGNHPSFASLDGLLAPRGTPLSELDTRSWTQLLPQTPLHPGAQNLCVPSRTPPVSHLRLNIFPDGGVARLRAYGTVEPDWSVRDVDAEAQPHVQPDWVDLAALTSGAVPLACSDAFFSPMEQLLMPGLARDMGGGWETRRRRAPGHDWILVQLGSPGVPRTFEVDTSHFKGNYPDRCSVDVLSAPVGTPTTELIASELWTPALAPRPLEAHRRHFFEALETPTVSHVRLAIHPDGGLSRFRVWGSR